MVSIFTFIICFRWFCYVSLPFPWIVWGWGGGATWSRPAVPRSPRKKWKDLRLPLLCIVAYSCFCFRWFRYVSLPFPWMVWGWGGGVTLSRPAVPRHPRKKWKDLRLPLLYIVAYSCFCFRWFCYVSLPFPWMVWGWGVTVCRAWDCTGFNLPLPLFPCLTPTCDVTWWSWTLRLSTRHFTLRSSRQGFPYTDLTLPLPRESTKFSWWGVTQKTRD